MPILPRQPHLFPGSVFFRADHEQRRAAPATTTVTRWIPVSDERMLVDVRFPDQGASIELEDVDLEPL